MNRRGKDLTTELIYIAHRARARGSGLARRMARGRPRFLLTSDIDSPDGLAACLSDGSIDAYLACCQGRIRELTVFVTTRSVDGSPDPGLGDLLGELGSKAARFGIKVRIESHGSSHVDFSALSLEEQVENIAKSVADLRDAGCDPTRFRAPSLSQTVETYRACRRLGLGGPITKTAPTDYQLLTTGNRTIPEGKLEISAAFENAVHVGRDVVVLYHFGRMADHRAPVFLGEYIRLSEQLCRESG
jgi:hypothetical protein